MGNLIVSGDYKSNYLRLIAAGHVEASALKILGWDWLDFFEACAKDPQFRKDIDLAREKRADKWVDDVAVSLEQKYYTEVEHPDTGEVIRQERAPTKDELGRDKLHFEKRKFLAQADNPKKYGNAAGKVAATFEFDMKDFKLLTPQEAAKALQSDPFAQPTIDAEFKEDKDDSSTT